MRKQYSTVKIPVELSEKLDEYVLKLGYRSRAEIVNDAIRRFIDSRVQLEEAVVSASPSSAARSQRKIETPVLTH